MKFVGRQYEITELNKQYDSNQFEMSIIYGRRRVGKTYLIRHFLEKHSGSYFVAIEANAQINLMNLSKAIYNLADVPQGLPNFKTFSEAMRFLFELSLTRRIVFAIDEYPYLAGAIKSASSELQALIDNYKTRSKLFLILCGSSMNFMENQVLGYKSPLYGRRTAQYRILPFNYLETRAFTNRMSLKDSSIIFGITGGIAEYLDFVDENKSLAENIINLFLSPKGRLYEEPENLLKQELREPNTYNDILTAIAGGASRNNQIATKIGLYSASLNNYLKRLIALGIVEKITPLTEKNSKRTIYRIADNMFKFWYRFVAPNMNLIQLGMAETVYKTEIEPHINNFMGAVFETISRQYLEVLIQQGKLPFIAKSYGSWWGTNQKLKRQEEIDIVVLNDDSALYAECKWRNEKTKKVVLDDLMRKAELLPRKNKYFYLFSMSGFTFNATENDNVKLVGLQNMYN